MVPLAIREPRGTNGFGLDRRVEKRTGRQGEIIIGIVAMAELIVDGLDAIVQLMTAVSDDDVGRIFWSGREVFLRGWREPDGFGWRFIWPVGNCPIGQLLAAVCTDHVFMLGTGLAGAIPGVLTTPFRRLLTVSGEDATPAMSASSIYL
jgi:hypothetical protein